MFQVRVLLCPATVSSSTAVNLGEVSPVEAILEKLLEMLLKIRAMLGDMDFGH